MPVTNQRIDESLWVVLGEFEFSKEFCFRPTFDVVGI